MATRTIHTLSYKLLVDGTQFKKGMGASRQELNFAKREMRSLLTPTEKMQHELNKLGEIAKKDATFQHLYNLKLKAYRTHLKNANQQSSLMTSATAKLSTALVGLGAAFAAQFSIRAAINLFTTTIDRVDTLAKVSDKLGISVERLTQLQTAADITSGIAPEQLSKGLEKMTRRVSEAAVGLGEAQGAIKELGLDAAQLASQSPDKAFMQIARAMDGVTAEHDRLRLATKLFDDEQAGLHTTLKLSNRELMSFESTLSTLDAQKAVAAKDAMTGLGIAFEKFSTEFVVSFAPAFTAFIRELTPFLNLENLGIAATIMVGRDPTKAISRLATKRAVASFNSGGSESKETIRKRRQNNEAMQAAALAKKMDADKMSMEDKKKKALEEALRLTESVRTAEEKHAATLEQINRVRLEGNISQETFRRLADQNDKDLRQSLISRIGEHTANIDAKKGTRFETSTFGPSASVSGGSSEEFNILNRRTVTKSIEVELAKQQVDYAKLSLEQLKRIAGDEGPISSGVLT